MHFSKRRTLLACTALAVALPVTAWAQDAATTDEGTQLQMIVIKGKRVPAGSVADTPLATTTTAEELRKGEVDSVADLGRTVEPSVDYVRASGGTAGGMYIRGLGGARVTTLVDNIPIPFLENYARSSAGSPTTVISDSSDSYDFSSLSALDVLKGADSSRAGAGALGGAVSARTLEPEDIIREGRNWGAVSKTTYDSEDESIGSSLAVAGRSANTSVLFQGSYKKGHERDNQGSDDIYGNSRTVTNPADYDQSNLLFKLRQELEGGHRIGLTAERFDSANDTDLKTLQGTVVSLPFVNPFTPGDYTGYEDTRRERVSLDYTFEAPETQSLIDSAMLTLYWQRLQKTSGSYGTRYSTGAAYARDNAMEENAVGLVGNTVSTFEQGALSHEVRIGGNLEVFRTEQFLTAVPATTASQSDIPDVEGAVVGLYAEDRIGVGSSGFSITPGVRLDWYDYRPQDTSGYQNNTGYALFGVGDARSDWAISPKLLAAYQVTPEVELFAQWSMAYRAPTVSELYLNFSNASSGYAVLGNPDLEAETGYGFELGANYETTDMSARVVGFYNKYKNFIDEYETTTTAFTNPFTGGPGTVYTFRNLDNVMIAGIEASARKAFDNGFILHGTLAYSYGEDEDTGDYLRSVAPFKAILGFGYETETWGADLSTILQAEMRDDGDDTTFDAPGYGIANLTAWWEPEQVEGLRVQAGIYNIFDRKYWNPVGVRDVDPTSVSSSNQPVDYYSEAGRTFKVSITKTF